VATATPSVGSGDWPTFLHDPERSSANLDESTLSPTNASQLTQLWAFKTGKVIAASASIVGGIVYVGSWDGNEYALDAKTGAQKWKTFIGQTGPDNCGGGTMGVSSAAAIQDGVVYVGGGDTNWYALDAGTGAVLWKVFTGDNSSSSGHYNWSSPLLYNGFAYIGVASRADCPLVQGQLIQVSLSTHQVVNTFNVVPDGQIGGGIWTSPSVDPSTNTVFVTTGTIHGTQPLSEAVLSLDATSLTQKGVWQLPAGSRVTDSDWGDTPILFTDSAGRQLVAAINKNGIAYAFDRNNLGKGPVWQTQVAIGGGNATAGDGSVSSGAFANNRLFFAGGNTSIGGTSYPGGVRALDPATGNFLWQHGAPGVVIAALAYANGLVVDGGGATLEVLDASSGKSLYSAKLGGTIYGAPSVSNGEIFAGATDGKLYAYGLPGTPPPPPPTDPTCPSGWSCQDIGSPTPAGSQSASGSTWSVTAGGTGVGGTADSFRLISQTASGDLGVSAHVALPASPPTGTQAGVMVRQSTDPGSPYYAAFASPGGGITVQYRTAFGGATTTLQSPSEPSAPLFLEVVRKGTAFQAGTSSDGVTYTAVPGDVAQITMPSSVLAGVATSSGAAGSGITISYGSVTVTTPGGAPAPFPTATPCPSGWSCADVGDPSPVGDQSLSSGTWTLSGAGSGLANYADQFHFVWQPLTGDGSVSARVGSQSSSGAGASAGVMLRQSTDAAASYYAATLTPGGVVVSFRDPSGMRSQQVVTVAGAAPAYLRVSRSALSFSASTSTDGVTWTAIAGSSTSLTLSGPVLGGLAVTSGDPATVDSATFTSVSVATAPTGCSAPAQTFTGTASSKSKTYTVTATGTSGCVILSWTGPAQLQITVYDFKGHTLARVKTGDPESTRVATTVGRHYKIKVRSVKGTSPYTLTASF